LLVVGACSRAATRLPTTELESKERKTMKRFVSIFVILALVGSAAVAASRTWKSSNGRFSVDAELLDFKDGKAQLKKSDGKVIEVPLVSLSEEDKRFVKSQFPGVEEEKIAPGAEYREWKSKNGKFTVMAEYQGLADGKVQLRKADGSELAVDKKLLSEDDQRWLASELERSREDDKEGKATDNGADEDVAGQIDEQEIAMKLVRLEIPKPKARGKSTTPTSYLFNMIAPQQIYVKLGQGEESKDSPFSRAVTKEPEYTAPTPVRGVVKFGSRQYGFALDSSGGKVQGYNKLYFDLDGNGDLTDDKPIASIAVNGAGDMSQSQFPRMDIVVEDGDKKIETSFLPSVICRRTQTESYATVTFYSAAYREGNIAQGKKQTKLLLLDHNSNGRFDDAVSLRPDGTPIEGDLLLINPNARMASSEMGRGQNYINKTVCIGRDFYKMDIPPSGDSLKLSPVKFAMGNVINSSPAYRAVLFSKDFGVVAIGGTKDQKIPLPESTWKVMSCTVQAGRPGTMMTATCGPDSPPVTVKKGEDAQLPLGPPLHAVVTAMRAGPDKISLSLAIVGVGGERCTNLMVNKGRPPKPKFVIKDKDGKTVHQGCFEWG
jgi:hypothetical protein